LYDHLPVYDGYHAIFIGGIYSMSDLLALNCKKRFYSIAVPVLK
jgi:hypothetical protein